MAEIVVRDDQRERIGGGALARERGLAKARGEPLAGHRLHLDLDRAAIFVREQRQPAPCGLEPLERGRMERGIDRRGVRAGAQRGADGRRRESRSVARLQNGGAAARLRHFDARADRRQPRVGATLIEARRFATVHAGLGQHEDSPRHRLHS